MTYNKISYYRTLLFCFIILIGLSYIIFLTIAALKIIPGFLMQFIFLLDSLVNHTRPLRSLLSSDMFLVNTFFGIILFFLLLKLITTTVQYIKKYLITRKYIKNIKIIATSNHINTFFSDQPQVFASGFLHPQIYQSASLNQLYSASEITAIIYHEQAHCQNHDPLKDFIVNYLAALLPVFPFKDRLFGHYSLLIETAADLYSENQIKSRLPIVTALSKAYYQKYFAVSAFSAQSQRISILVGATTLPLKSLIFANLVLVSFIFYCSYLILSSDIFYQCHHLALCFQSVFNSNYSPLLLDNPLTTYYTM